MRSDSGLLTTKTCSPKYPPPHPTPSLHETNVDRCVPGRTTVHFFICVLCGLCVLVYLLLMELHCSKYNQRECTETVWCVESWIFFIDKANKEKLWNGPQCIMFVACPLSYCTCHSSIAYVQFARNEINAFFVFFAWGM